MDKFEESFKRGMRGEVELNDSLLKRSNVVRRLASVIQRMTLGRVNLVENRNNYNSWNLELVRVGSNKNYVTELCSLEQGRLPYPLTIKSDIISRICRNEDELEATLLRIIEDPMFTKNLKNLSERDSEGKEKDYSDTYEAKDSEETTFYKTVDVKAPKSPRKRSRRKN